MVNLPTVTYLSTDSVQEGIGASQVGAYAEGLARRGVRVELHSYEKREPSDELRRRMAKAGVDWRPHAFKKPGSFGGVRRLLHGAAAVARADLVHARSDLAAASAMLGMARSWVWDVRALWVDQRLDLGSLRAGSATERVLRRLEAAAARRSAAMVTLTSAVLPVLDARHGPGTSAKATVIPTSVDTSRFVLSEPPPICPLRMLLSGTVNRYYDVPAMAALVRPAKQRGPTELTLISPGPTAWDDELADVVDHRLSVDHDEMPVRVVAAHVGLAVCRQDVGISRVASMPTKIAEFLASGRPIIVNEGLGDASELVRSHHVGVVLGRCDVEDLDRGLDELEELLADPALAHRCRSLALGHFSLDHALDQLIGVYARAVSP